MARPIPTPLELRIRQTRRRLFTQTLLNRLGVAWGLALLAGIAWFLVEPAVAPSADESVKWLVLGGLGAIGTSFAIWLARRAAPSPLSAALALDQRFQLNERATTALGLAPNQQSSLAGQALITDANATLAKVVVKERFPVRLGWRAAFLPVLATGVVLLALFPVPIQKLLADGPGKNADEDGKADDSGVAVKPTVPRSFIKPPVERTPRTEQLRDLQAELDRLYEEHNRSSGIEKEKPEKMRERQEKLASAEEILKKREQELSEKFQKLQEEMTKSFDLENGATRQEGPAKDFEEAMAKGNLKKAEEEADRLKKKVKEKKLDAKDTEQLKKQLDDMKERIDRLTREQEKKKQDLKDKIDEAKREKRDAESLERELNKLEQEQKMTPEMQELAKSIKSAKQSLEKGDMESLAEQLENVGKQLGDLQEELKDLDDVEEHLQNLRQMKKEGCKACEGEGDKKGEGGPKDDAKGYAEGASGRRPENKDAKTKAGDDERIRGFFDTRGRKSYGGATNGPAFKKATSIEMEGEIRQAVQEAPEAVEVQRLPKATKDMVKEYFEKLGGGQGKK